MKAWVSLMLVLEMAVSAYADLSSGLVAHYEFEGNADDSSGNGNDGMNSGGSLTSDRFGNFNSAYELQPLGSSGDTITLYSPGNHTDFSLNFWGYSTFNNYMIDTRNPGYGDFIFSNGQYVPNGEDTLGFFAGDTFYDTEMSIDDNWHMFSISYDYSQAYLTIYVDGDYVYGIKVESSFNLGTQLQLESGRNNQVLDDFRVYNRILSASEISSLYECELAGSCESCDTTESYNSGYEAGKAYCIANPSACGIDTSDDNPPTFQCSDDFSVSSGWNLLGSTNAWDVPNLFDEVSGIDSIWTYSATGGWDNYTILNAPFGGTIPANSGFWLKK